MYNFIIMKKLIQIIIDSRDSTLEGYTYPNLITLLDVVEIFFYYRLLRNCIILNLFLTLLNLFPFSIIA